ncbi:hypothetical protein D3C77_325790 [compost metagenome]
MSGDGAFATYLGYRHCKLSSVSPQCRPIKQRPGNLRRSFQAAAIGVSDSLVV